MANPSGRLGSQIAFHDSWKRPQWSTNPPLPPSYGGTGKGPAHALPPCTQGPAHALPPVLKARRMPSPLYSGGARGGKTHNRLMETRIRQGFSTNRETQFGELFCLLDAVCGDPCHSVIALRRRTVRTGKLAIDVISARRQMKSPLLS